MTRSTLIVAALVAACARSPQVEVQAEEGAGSPAPTVAAAAPEVRHETPAAPDPDPEPGPEATVAPAEPPPELPRLDPGRFDARSGEPEMLRAPADWRMDSRGLPMLLAERLARIDEGRGHPEDEDLPKTSRLYSLRVPDTEHLWCHWYLSSRQQVMGDRYHVFLEDRSTGRMTAEPVVHGSNWLSYPPPDPHFVDLDGDGRRELRLKDLHHNGTWNVHQESYWEYGEDLSLTCALALVTSENELLPEGAHFSWDNLRDVERELRRTAGGDLVVDVCVRGTTAGSPREDQGRLWLVQEPGAERWTVAERLLLEPGGDRQDQVALHGGWAWGWLVPPENDSPDD